MGWERQKSTVVELPKIPSFTSWLIAGLGALVFCVLLFFLHSNQLLGTLQQYNLWLLSLSPVFLWGILICLRGWIYNHTVDRHEFESKEAEHAQQQWVVWAGRYLAVLHSGVILAEEVTPKTILLESGGLIQHNQQALRIDIRDRLPFSLLLGAVCKKLQQLPHDLQLTVTLLTDTSEDMSVLQRSFADCWQQLMPAGAPIPSLRILHSYSFDAVESRLKSVDISVELLLIHQMEGAERYSDALATLLMTSDDVATKYGLEHDVRLLRPMPLNAKNLFSELELFFSTQTQANTTQRIIGDRSQWGCIFPSVLKASEDYGGYWKTEQLHWLETYAGVSGPFSPWLLTAVTSDVVRLLQVDCLMLSGGEEDQCFINTVTTGNKNEING